MAEQRKDHAVIDIKKPLPSSFQNFMPDELSLSPNACIFKTPTILSRHNEQAYKPNAFSFGPFHYGSQKLEPTQKIKLKYLKDLLTRSKTPDELYKKLIGTIESIQKEAREYYAGSIEPPKEGVFSDILLLDGCFIIEFFRKDAGVVSIDLDDDPIFSMSCLQEFLNHDLILLENQIPWLILEHLFNLTKSSGGKHLIQLALDYFGNIFSSVKPTIGPDQFEGVQIKHILDLLRHSLLLPLKANHDENSRQGKSVWEPLPSATKIHGAGIKFRKKDADIVLDLVFTNGVLQVPPLLIQETTETIFRNLISLEQCCPNYEPIVTSYAKFMDNIIDTDDDVEILCEKDILDNWLNPEDVKKFFNKLYNDAYVKKFYYGDICQQVNSYRKRWWPKWRFFYVQNYFGKPWAIVSQVVATILLVLTLLQTLYSILGFMKDC